MRSGSSPKARPIASRSAVDGAVGIVLQMLAELRDKPRSPAGSGPSGVSFDDSLNTRATPGAALLPGT